MPQLVEDSWSLPSRPRLLPDVLLSPGPQECLIVASTPRQLLTIPRGGSELVAWLRGLDGLLSGSQAAAQCPLGRSAGIGILRQLDHHGLLAPTCDPWHVRARPGSTGADALALAQARQRRHVEVVGDEVFCAPVVHWLTDAGVTTRWRTTPRCTGDLLVWVGPTGHPSAPALATLDSVFVAGVPWLTVEVTGQDAVISAASIPGYSPCGRCRWLTQLDRQPTLALLADRWPEQPIELPRHLTALLQGLIVERVLFSLDALMLSKPTTARAWSRDVIVDFRTASVRDQDVTPHPQCGCLAPAA